VSWHPRLSVDEECAGPLAFTEEIEFWRTLGVDNIGMIGPRLQAIDFDVDLVRSTGVTVSNVVCSDLRIIGRALEFAAAIGSDSLWVTPGSIGSRLWEEAAEDFCGRYGPSITRAKELDLQFGVQPTNSIRCDLSFIFTLRDAIELAKMADTGVILELECCWYERGLQQLVRDHVDMITLVQIGDFQIGTTSSPNRSAIGDGDIPLERLIAIILDAGYTGMFDLELIGPKIEAEGWFSATRRSLEAASEILDRLGA
jgi:sugar phosphate isomerase/epimerase